MKAMILALVATACVVQSASADPAGDALATKATDCIRSEAPRVSSVSSGLVDAVNFLMTDLCAVEIKHAEAYELSSRSLAEWQATTAGSQLTGISIDPATGELKTPPNFTPPFNPGTMMLSVFKAGGSLDDQFRATAAKAVLSARSKG